MESIVASGDRLHYFQYIEVTLLEDYLRNGITYFCSALLNSHPRLLPLRYYSQEIASLFHLIIDFYSLNKHNAIYPESFYNFQRKQRSKAFFTLILWVLLPYMASKLQSCYEMAVAQQIDQMQMGVFKRVLLKVYPYLSVMIKLLNIAMRFLYLMKPQNRFFDVRYWLSGQELKHREAEPSAKYPILQLAKRPGLLILLLSHKLFNWYYTKKPKSAEQMKIVPPPKVREYAAQNRGCPLCKGEVRGAVVVKTNGYVYCGECIREYVVKHGKCPYTEVPITISSLTAVYL